MVRRASPNYAHSLAGDDDWLSAAAGTRADVRCGRGPVAHMLLRRAGPRKLRLEFGRAVRLPGWLVMDLEPAVPQIRRVQASGLLPFADGIFDYIHGVHVIEHVPWRCGLRLLKECRRVLKPGGVVRIVTPDMAIMAGALTRRRPLRLRLLAQAIDLLLKDTPARPAFAVNAVFRSYQHEFLYDAEALELTLRLAGFARTSAHALGRSEDPQLASREPVFEAPGGRRGSRRTLALEGR